MKKHTIQLLMFMSIATLTIEPSQKTIDLHQLRENFNRNQNQSTKEQDIIEARLSTSRCIQLHMALEGLPFSAEKDQLIRENEDLFQKLLAQQHIISDVSTTETSDNSTNQVITIRSEYDKILKSNNGQQPPTAGTFAKILMHGIKTR